VIHAGHPGLDRDAEIRDAGEQICRLGTCRPAALAPKMSYALHRRSTLRQSRSDWAEGRAGSTLASTQAKRFEEMIRKLE
jgi:hypothetical protein